MNNQVQQFYNKEFGSIEIMMLGDKPYFPAKECAKMLGYKDATNAIKQHCRWVVKHHLPHPQSSGKVIEVNFIPEGDLYRLIIRSKLPAAERFERWVFDEVLPTIRKYGAYLFDDVLDEAAKNQDYASELFSKLQAEKGKTAALLDKVETLAPKARYCDQILRCKNTVQVTLIAKDYGMTAVAFNRLLHDLGIQYRIGTTWVLYKNIADQDYTRSNTYITPGGCGIIHTCWTQKGRLFLYETLCEFGILPLMESECPDILGGCYD